MCSNARRASDAALYAPSNVLPLAVAAARLGVSAEWLIEAACPHYRIAVGKKQERGRRFVYWPEVERWILRQQAFGERETP